jgi:Ca2+/Na+ antiporter
MKDFDHIMSVWQEQPKRDQLSVDEALKQVKKGMGSLNQKMLFNITSMLAALVAIFFVMIFLVFQSWVTYAGIAIMLSTMVMYVAVMIKDYRLINKRDVTINPTEYLQSLKEYQRRRADMYGWLYYIYVLLLSLGLSLYLYEVLQLLKPVTRFIAYGATIAWLLFCTFYLKDRIFKSEQDKLNLMIDRLVRLQDQFTL